MNYYEKLIETAEKNKSIVCMGMDPILEKIPIKGNCEDVLVEFYKKLLDATHNDIGAVKPNIAFYEQYGFEGLRALKKIIEIIKSYELPFILDAKRGDIGKTSAAYAKNIFDFWKADCVTIAPYMGSDSVGPFLEWCEKGKGVYILNRTSNKGAFELQNLIIDGKPLFMRVAEKIIEWGDGNKNVGCVIGATSLEEMKDLSSFYKDTPFLIPGVGAQGASASEVTDVLRKTNQNLAIHRINSSSGINFAYIKNGEEDFVNAALTAVKELNKEIGY